jgi:16S rRNA A1518/A1519 N6-dimethyltransferase RsmA/KsgA/DIM1 with predicted DNA glycosylase/AP lyase activity
MATRSISTGRRIWPRRSGSWPTCPTTSGTELLVRWLTPEAWPPLWSSMTLMFQREVAERIVAQPGSKAYGRLAILAQWRTTARIAMTLPPEAFTPPPKVRSAVVHLDALPAPRFPADPRGAEPVVAAAFNQRRKMLRAALKGQAPDIEDPSARRGDRSDATGRGRAAGGILRAGAGTRLTWQAWPDHHPAFSTD